MTSPRYQHASIAAAGLDLLHMTRLKVACSLLMAERVHAELHDWPGADIRLLVAGVDTAPGAAAAAEGRDTGVAVLSIARNGHGNVDVLHHGATVKDMFDRLLRLLADDAPVVATTAAPLPQRPSSPDASERSQPVPRARRLLDQVATASGIVTMLECGDLRLAIDRDRGVLHLPDDGADVALVQACERTDWRVEHVARAAFDPMRAGLPAVAPLETFVWQAASQSADPVGERPVADVLGLKGWPAVDADLLPAGWILPLACLLQRPWSSRALAETCGLAETEMARIFAAVHHSGLAHVGESRTSRVTPVPAPDRSPASAGLLARVARRFGLHFGGSRG